ncbi:ATP-binding cassette domain-containing protein [Microcella sp.]|uniref:ATP-binding cassette domain-containing protein n=1 Tax=Microcella sp. TaxID=1913979 RepID=UPI00391A3330
MSARPMAIEGAVRVRRGSLAIDVDIAVPAGQTLAVIGPNGAGKSSLLLAIAGSLALAEGSLAIEGRVVDAPPAPPVPPEQRGVGMVFSDPLLFPHLTALENVAVGPRAHGAPRAQAQHDARAWLERFGVGAVAGLRPGALSSGEAQRVALARALAAGPRLLLLDEPLAALDVAVHDSVRAELARCVRERGIGVVIVTHARADVAALADEVLVIESGRATQRGTLAALEADPATAFVRRFTLEQPPSVDR